MTLCDETIKFIGGNLGFMQINVNDSIGVSFYLRLIQTLLTKMYNDITRH